MGGARREEEGHIVGLGVRLQAGIAAPRQQQVPGPGGEERQARPRVEAFAKIGPHTFLAVGASTSAALTSSATAAAAAMVGLRMRGVGEGAGEGRGPEWSCDEGQLAGPLQRAAQR